MKKLLYFAFLGVFAFFGTVNCETIDIKWGADNQTYTTTTCTVGGDVILPTPPTKRGYVFRGWQKDVFNRGKWSNWAHVPSVSSDYPADYHGNHVPEQNDYMVVYDASDYLLEEVEVFKLVTHSTGGSTASMDVTVTSTGELINYMYKNVSQWTQISGTDFYISYPGSWRLKNVSAPFTIDGVIYPVGSVYSWQYDQTINKSVNVSLGNLEGTWRFVYDGDWSTDGKNGWKPVEQIANE